MGHSFRIVGCYLDTPTIMHAFPVPRQPTRPADLSRWRTMGTVV